MTEPKSLKELLQEIIDIEEADLGEMRPDVGELAQQALDAAGEFELLRSRNDYLEAQFQRLGAQVAAWRSKVSQHNKTIESQKKVRCSDADCDGGGSPCCPLPEAPEKPEMPEGYAVLPTRLTAENGAKYLLLGEFHSEVVVDCESCEGAGFHDEDEQEECEGCRGAGTQTLKIPVSWTSIKEIWAKAADALALSGVPGE